MKKKKLIATIVSCAVFISVLTAGVTLAILTQITETATNTFSSSKSIAIKLREPSWDGFNFDKDYTSAPGTVVNPEFEGNKDTLGLSMASEYVPGDIIPKDPTVKNTSRDEEVYVALKATFYKGVYDSQNNEWSYVQIPYTGTQEGVAYFTSLYGTVEIDSEWTKISEANNDQLFFYEKTLGVNGETPALFENVKLKLDIEPDENERMPQFKIELKAYAVQGKNVDVSEAKSALIDLSNVKSNEKTK